MSFKSKLSTGLASAALALILVAFLSYWNMAHQLEDRQWVTHTYAVLEKLDDLHASLIDAETAVRGYVSEPSDSSLEAFQKGREEVDLHFKEMRDLTVDNPTQQKALDDLAPLLKERIEDLEERMKARREGGQAAVLALLQANYGRGLMNQIRQGIVSMRAEENRLLVKRSAALEVSSRRTRMVVAAGEGLGFLLLLAAGILIQREMTQRKRAEAEVLRLNADLEQRVAERTSALEERAMELKRSNQELQQFAYVASHDLQEPLRTISSFTQLLAKRYSDRIDDKGREFIAFAVDGCKRMQTLINDLLTFSRVGTHGQPLTAVKCEEALDRVLRSLKIAIDETGAQITKDPLPVVLADETQLCQLFQNLLGNAIKFHGKEIPRIHISAERDVTGWKIAVRDNGIGIRQEHADRIFVIFQRLHTKQQYPGTGIGLAICKKIAERHGGKIWVEAAPGGGSKFCFLMQDGQPAQASTGGKNALRFSVAAH